MEATSPWNLSMEAQPRERCFGHVFPWHAAEQVLAGAAYHFLKGGARSNRTLHNHVGPAHHGLNEPMHGARQISSRHPLVGAESDQIVRVGPDAGGYKVLRVDEQELTIQFIACREVPCDEELTFRYQLLPDAANCVLHGLH